MRFAPFRVSGLGLWGFGILGFLGFGVLGVWGLGFRVISPLNRALSFVATIITLLVTTHEPPSRFHGLRGVGLRVSGLGGFRT